MAREVSINLNVLEETANEYRKTHEDISAALKDIDATMQLLQSSKWISEASQVYFTQYTDDWKTSVEHHLVALDKVAEGLEFAKEEYMQLYNDIPRLADALDFND